MNKNLTLFALANVALGSFFFQGNANAQNPPDPKSAAIVSTAENGSEANVEHAKSSLKNENADEGIVADPATLLPAPAPLPRANATLVGGTLERLDRVRDKVTVHVFGGGQVTALFDPRTRIYSGREQATAADLKVGQRIYLDTILDGSTVFARAIRVTAPRAIGESQGVVLSYRADRNELSIRDALSPTPIAIRLTPSTEVKQADRTVPADALAPGALVSISFTSGGEKKNTAREISILALPGDHFTFTGVVMHLNLSTGLLVLDSSTDHKTYEVYLDPSVTPDQNLHVGAIVTVMTEFDGSRYMARNLAINSPNQ